MKIRYYPDTEPGFRRRRWGRGFTYFDLDGTRIDCAQEKARLKAMAVPPAYAEVWMTPYENGHLQATGRDDRGRKQYLYHEAWRAAREEKKFADLPQLADALPRIRRWIADRLSDEAEDRDRAVAAVLALIDRASLRPGNPRYAAENGSYGATTLLNRHVRFDGNSVKLSYRGKGGKRIRKSVTGQRLVKTLQACRDLPGAKLMGWLDENGITHDVTTDAVNTKLAELCDAPVTAKSLRTWNGTRAAFLTALDNQQSLSVAAMAKASAECLHNTPTVSRSSYIHPAVIGLAELPEDERLRQLTGFNGAARDGLRSGEADLRDFLSKR